MALPRLVVPEFIDQLPADDPGAIRIRQDLDFINSVIPNVRLVADALAERFPQGPRTIMDIGCGNGAFMLKAAQRLSPRWRNVTVRLVDQQALISDDTRAAFAALGWTAEPVAADILEYLRQPHAPQPDAIVANLFLHHFPQDALATLLGLIANATPYLIACEPRRAKLSLRIGQMAWLGGLSDLTCHDVATSVWAGFKGHELSALWPDDGTWTLREFQSWPFVHGFVAQRAG
jgi:SAM-dependent methyltransferase